MSGTRATAVRDPLDLVPDCQSTTAPGEIPLGIAGIVPPAAVTGAARQTLAELRQKQSLLYSQVQSPPGTPLQDRPEFWLGKLEGTIAALLAVIPGGDGRLP